MLLEYKIACPCKKYVWNITKSLNRKCMQTVYHWNYDVENTLQRVDIVRELTRG